MDHINVAIFGYVRLGHQLCFKLADGVLCIRDIESMTTPGVTYTITHGRFVGVESGHFMLV